MRSAFFTAAAALVASQLVQAQTFTDCNPLEKTCPTEDALGTSIEIDFTKGKTNHFFELDGTKLTYGPEGAEFIIAKESNAPTIESHWNILFGRVEVTMKAAHGRGIVSSLVLESSTLDEVDWEWIGSDYDSVQTNYYGKGNTTTYDRAIYHPHPNGQLGFHTYTIDWTPEHMKWFIDGAEIRHLNYADAVGGLNYPQTPMKVKMGNWVGGGSKSPEGTREWAGGFAEWDQAPFTMVVQKIRITDGHPGAKSYTYTDNSGSWQSIKVEGGDGAQFNEETSSESSSVEPTTTKTSTKASSTVVSTTTDEETSTLITSTTATIPTTTGGSNSTVTTTESSDDSEPTEDSDPAETSDPAVIPEGAASSLGANFALIVAAGALSYFAL